MIILAHLLAHLVIIVHLVHLVIVVHLVIIVHLVNIVHLQDILILSVPINSESCNPRIFCLDMAVNLVNYYLGRVILYQFRSYVIIVYIISTLLI